MVQSGRSRVRGASAPVSGRWRRRLAALTGLAVLGSLLVLASAPTQAAPVEGFVQERYASGVPLVTDIEWGPNGLLYVAHQSGSVSVVDNGVVTSTFVDISAEVNSAGERGLLGLALHPDFLTGSPFVYLLYSYDPPETAGETGPAGPDGNGQRISRLTRLTADSATGFTTAVPGSATTILGAGGDWTTLGDPNSIAGIGDPWACGNPPSVDDCLAADADTHGVGTVRFGPDGMLYVGNGDGSTFTAQIRSTRALDLDSLSGKILRIHPDTGLGLSDNPHASGQPLSSNRARVYHSGLRNPYRFTFAPAGDLLIGDVGSGTWEEINNAPAGADFGWPCYEGGAAGTLEQNVDFQSTPECQAYYGSNSAVPPVYSYSHAVGSAAIIAGEVVPANGWPAEFQDTLIVADYVRSTIDAVNLSGGTPTVTPLATAALAVDLTFGPDGHLYFADISQSSVERIRYAPGTQPPGLLRVTSSPPAPTMISANGLERSQWGLDWLMTEPGPYEVCFSDVPGLVTPACRTVSVVSGVTTSTQGDVVLQGTIIVSALAEGTGAALPSVITLDGAAVASGGVSTVRDPGLVEVCWGAVADFDPPGCQMVSVPSGGTLNVDGVFQSNPGAPGPTGPAGLLRVTTSPAIPTTVLLDGRPLTQWSTEWVPTAPGSYELCFSDVPGYVTPACETITINDGLTTAVVGAFEQMGTLRATTNPPSNVVISVDGVPRNNWGAFTHIAPGTYTVCAAFVAAPTCDTAVVVGGAETLLELAPTGGGNQAPVANAGPDQTVLDADDSGAETVTLDGSASFDPDGTIVDHTWRDGGVVVATGVSPQISLALGTHTVELTVTDNEGATATDTVVITVVAPPIPPDVVYMSPDTAGSVPGVSYGDEDILRYDRVGDTWSMYFDGSDVGVTDDLSGFHILADGSILMAFVDGLNAPGFGNSDPWDLVRFVPTSTGSTTSGSFEVYFEGKDVDLRNGGESIDALAVLPNGDLIMSIAGDGDVPGVGPFTDHDLVRFEPIELSNGTDGTWSMWLDGSDVGLSTADEDVNAVTTDPAGDIYLSTLGSFSVPGLTGSNSDVFTCGSPTTGGSSACTFAEYWTSAGDGFSGTVDAIFVEFG